MTQTGRTDRRPGAGRGWAAAVSLSAIFVALAVALGFLLISVPNIELLTFTVFAAGSVLGRWRGAVVGALAMALYSGLNPFGSGIALPPLYAAQIGAMALAGLAGGLWGSGYASGIGGTHAGRPAPAGMSFGAPPGGERPRPSGSTTAAGASGSFVARGHEVISWLAVVGRYGATGFILTLVYQCAVIAGIAVSAPGLAAGFWAAVAANALFSIVHIVSNTVLFAVLGPTVLPRLARMCRTRIAPEAACRVGGSAEGGAA